MLSVLVESPNFKALQEKLKETADTIAKETEPIDFSGLQLPEDTVITVEKLLDDTVNKIRKLPTEDGDFFKTTKKSTNVAFQHTTDSSLTGFDTDRRPSEAFMISGIGGRVALGNSAPARTVVTKTKITTPEDATCADGVCPTTL